MTIDCLETETGPDPRTSILILHGLGADGTDFMPVANEWDLRSLGPVRFVFPNAPEMPVTINGGYRMPAWYDITGQEAALRIEDEAGLRRSQAGIEEVIAREKSRGVAASRIVVAGFSQGCAMALLTGLRHAESLGGIIGMSGYLPLAAKTEAERHANNHRVPIFMAHGTHDPMIPIQRATQSRDYLVSLGYDVEWHEYPMPHSVHPQEIADMERWLLRVLA